MNLKVQYLKNQYLNRMQPYEKNTTLVIMGVKENEEEDVPITVTVDAKSKPYGPVITVKITCDIPYVKHKWADHPLMHVKSNYIENSVATNIIDDTPAIRALIDELVGDPLKLYTTTNCTHKGRLIRAILSFWS